jgi:aspartyl aminopeptidase
MASFDRSSGSQFAGEFVDFLNEACTAFHAVDACATRLVAKGFSQISEKEAWSIEKGGKYFFTRNQTRYTKIEIIPALKSAFLTANPFYLTV